MYNLIENLKRFPIIKKIGKNILKIRGLYFRLVANKNFYRTYQEKFLELPGCKDSVNSLYHQYLVGNLKLIDKPLIFYYDKLWEIITEKIEKKEGYIIVRVSDGEANFLNGIIKGNTATRHFTVGSKPNNEYLDQFKKGLLLCDSIHVEMYKKMHNSFNRIYGKNIFSPIPFECIYALVASRKIFKNNYRVGIIGPDNKIEIIKRLFEHKEYCEYIGRDKFDHYITVPENGTSNNVNALLEDVSSKFDPEIDLYLVGIGIAKMAVLGKLKERSSAVFLDVGAGISALAGLVSHDRPYFAEWINFRLKDFDYSKVDVMDADMVSADKRIFL